MGGFNAASTLAPAKKAPPQRSFANLTGSRHADAALRDAVRPPWAARPAASSSPPVAMKSGEFSKRLLLSDAEVPGLLGPGGARLNAIRQKVHPGARISLQACTGGAPRLLLLSGSPQAVTLAEQLIREAGVRFLWCGC